MFDSPELFLTDKEGAEFADVIKEVAKFHEVTFDPKKMAYFQLTACMGSIYVPRIRKIWKRAMGPGSTPAQSPSPRPAPTPINTQPQRPPKPVNEMTPAEAFGDESASL